MRVREKIIVMAIIIIAIRINCFKGCENSFVLIVEKMSVFLRPAMTEIRSVFRQFPQSHFVRTFVTTMVSGLRTANKNRVSIKRLLSLETERTFLRLEIC